MRTFFKIIIFLVFTSSFVKSFSQNTISFSLIDSKPFTPVTEKQFDINKEYTAYVQVFLPEKEKNNGRTVIICPGGGYSMVAFGHEGTSWAQFFNPLGITVMVVKYSLPKGNYSIPLNNVKTAFQILKDHASEWNINLNDVGIMGFSAGGHLASTIATHPKESFEPAFQILFYPVITMNSSFTHMGSRDNFLGKNPTNDLVEKFSNEKQVNSKTPPAFIVFAEDDQVVSPYNSIHYYEALLDSKVSTTLLTYPTGNHGWGYSKRYKYQNLIEEELKLWLQFLNSKK